ncbi:NAD(+) synthase [uncultured Oscillibacter sp.]|jgi:NAD+ synthase|uniref:NAD(+) synthase n=1 Tax=uncultured Oscillibacter sp. TaxID=876091 RepID=UPI002624F9B6|nr:NAD(+) synthase [uncultured Oscillibacter sp.]
MKTTSSTPWAEWEVQRILAFIKNFAAEDERVVVPVSGGLDSDLTARLCRKSLGRERVKLFIVVQSDLEPKFLVNARALAEDLDLPLAEIHLEQANEALMSALEQGESEPLFHMNMALDPAKAKCSVRSSVLSCYQDKGFLIAGSTNRSEKELGFFLTFGDNLAHFKPLAHLYKSRLYPLARIMGTRETVLTQEPSAGFWSGQTDAEDLAYWIVNDGPIMIPRHFSTAEKARVQEFSPFLTYENIDQVLELHAQSVSEAGIISQTSLPDGVVTGIIHIVEKAKRLKNRPLLVELPGEGDSCALPQAD